MKKWLRSDPVLLVWRIAVVYAVLAVCRLVFLLYNGAVVGHIAPDEVWALVRGSIGMPSR